MDDHDRYLLKGFLAALAAPLVFLLKRRIFDNVTAPAFYWLGWSIGGLLHLIKKAFGYNSAAQK